MKKPWLIFNCLLQLILISRAGAQSPAIKWWFNTHDASFGQPAAKDLDGDGKLEVVFGCYRNDSMVYVLNGENGSLLWKYNTHPFGAEGCNDVAPVIYDVDSDGQPDVVVPSSCNPKTFCFNGATGSVKWTCNTSGSDSPPTIADVDNDGKPEILHGEFGGSVICINAENGSVAWEISVDSNSWVQTAPTIVDLNSDGQLDFVVGTWNFNYLDSIFAYSGNNHTRLWAYPVHDHMYHGTAVADFDLDGKPELLIGSYNDTLYCINGENGTTSWKYKSSGYIGSPVSLGDLDHDGKCDVVFANGSEVTALSNTGVLKWTYSLPVLNAAFRGAALADINNDIYLDVIFGVDNGQVIALNGNNGSLIWSLDLAAHYGDSLFAFDNAPLIADFDGDDTLDVFIVGGHGEYPQFSNDFGRAYLISAGKGRGPDWLMFQRDVRRQSSLCDNGIYTDVPAVLNSAVHVASIYPDPSSTSATLRFSNSENDSYTLNIYNSAGQLLYQQEKIMGSEVKLEFSEWPDGLFFFQLHSGIGASTQGKFLIQK